MSTPTVAPAGWYPNPEHADQRRYWDGSSWTDRCVPTQAETDPPVVPDDARTLTDSPPEADIKAEDTETELIESRSDIKDAVRRMGRTMGIHRELRTLESRLEPGEIVMDIARVKRGGHGCMLAITNHRLLFVREGMIRETVEEIQTRSITSFRVRRRLMNGYLDVTVASKEEIWEMTSATHAQRVGDALRQAMHMASQAPVQTGPSSPVSAPAPTAQVDIASKIRELAILRDEGLLTPDEFAQQKAKILSP